MDANERAELRRLAGETFSPEPYQYIESSHIHEHAVKDADGHLIAQFMEPEDARFLAAWHPGTALRALDQIEALATEAKRLWWAISTIHDMADHGLDTEPTDVYSGTQQALVKIIKTTKAALAGDEAK